MLTNLPLRRGDVLTRRSPALTQVAFDIFGEYMGFDAPIHTDPAYAAGTPFSGTFAQGMLLLSFFEPWLRELFGVEAWTERGRLTGKLLSPAFVGETLTLELTCRDLSSNGMALDLRIVAADRVIAVGEVGINTNA
ncbi:MaoC family dehydratase [Mesorhizobium sp. 1B3]|uniref:MaoC family dehydratase n=1 Tax=Mesorhizobium sp. 1B3 TaxID=3243599 RepID=UPI003D95C671